MRTRWIDTRDWTAQVPMVPGIMSEEPSSRPSTADTFSPVIQPSPYARACRKFAGNRGVTLRELVIALILVAILAAVAIAHRSTLNPDAFADGETLKSCIRATQTRALADIVSWSFQVNGQTGTYKRNGVSKGTVAFATTGVAAGTITFDNRGRPSGTQSFAVTYYPHSPVTVTNLTGFVP